MKLLDRLNTKDISIAEYSNMSGDQQDAHNQMIIDKLEAIDFAVSYKLKTCSPEKIASCDKVIKDSESTIKSYCDFIIGTDSLDSQDWSFFVYNQTEENSIFRLVIDEWLESLYSVDAENFDIYEHTIVSHGFSVILD